MDSCFAGPPAAGDAGSFRGHGVSSEPLGWALEALRMQGYAMVRFSDEEKELVDALVACSRGFFARETRYKETFKVYPTPGGYLTPFPGTYELFELRRGLASCPEELRKAMAAFALFERLALRVCEELGRDIGVDLAAMLTDNSPTLRLIHYDRPFESRGPLDHHQAPGRTPAAGTSVRLVMLAGEDGALNGAKGTVLSSAGSAAEVELDAKTTPRAVVAARGSSRIRVPLSNLRVIDQDAPGMYPAHADSSLVTVAPRSTAAGLEAKDLRTGEWFRLEERMRDDECLIFLGDPLDYASGHRYRALMHRPAVPCAPLAGEGVRPRISTPFFLYPHEQAILKAPGLPGLAFGSLNTNAGGCRDRMPWRRVSCYYSDLVYS